MKKFMLKRFFCWSIVFAILLVVADELLARAGGGRGYSSGRSGRSFGGNGDGDGIFFLIYFLIRLAFQYPLIGIPLLIFAIIVFIVGSKKGHSAHVARAITKTYNRYDTQKVEAAELKLRERDAKFNRGIFLGRIKKAFNQIQDAWAKQDMKPVRHLVSDGIFERFSIQFDIQKASLIRNKMENIQILSADIADIESDPFFDTIHVKITASATDYFVRTDNGNMVSGSKSMEPFTEYWSFLRRPGTQSLEKPGLLEGYCPNCGALLEMADCTVCPSCKALINSGEYDWVLAEITQPAEWSQRYTQTIPGLKELVTKDPAFNIQHIEDKASVMFYRYVAARFFAEPNYLVKMANPEYIKTNEKLFKKLDNGKHEFYADAAVGTVDIVEIINSTKENGMDTIRLKVKWAAHQLTAQIPSFMRPDFTRNHIYMTDFILKRQASVKSSDKNILTSAHCPGCGAPETQTTTGSCEYCHTPLNDGSSDWILCDIRRFSGYPTVKTQYHSLETAPTSQKTATRSLSTFDRENIISCAIAVMLADGKMDQGEKRILLDMVKENGIDASRLDMLINTVRDGELHIPAPTSQAEANEFLRCMVAMCVADGHVSSKERQLIKQLVSKMNYTDMDINQMIKQETSRLHQQVKNYRSSSVKSL